MDPVPGRRLVAQSLAAHGVGTVFAGADLGPELRQVLLPGDRAAAHAAVGWGHIRRLAGVAAVSDVTAALPALVAAFDEQTPLVVLGIGDDRLDLARPVTKWVGACTRAEAIPDAVAAAFRQALAAPRGPACLALGPGTLDAAAVPDRPPAPSRSTARTFGDPRAIMEAAAVLAAAERPVAVAGSAIWWDGASRQLRAFAENGRLPVFLLGSARGALRPGHELLFGHGLAAALAEADAVCVIGTRVPCPLPDAARLVHIHADPTELGRDRAPDAGIVGDTAAVLGILADAVRYRSADREPWIERLRRDGDSHRAASEPDSARLDARRIATELDTVAGPDAVVIVDGGILAAACTEVLRTRQPGRWLSAGPDALLPYAVGVATARPHGQVVAIADAETPPELELLARLRPRVTLLIGNRTAARYDLVAEAFGVPGERVSDTAALRPALERALATDGPAVVDAALAREEHA